MDIPVYLCKLEPDGRQMTNRPTDFINTFQIMLQSIKKRIKVKYSLTSFPTATI